MKNKHILFSTVSCMIIFSFEVEAQCVSTQDCAALGYSKSSSCVDGIKCPFGNAWYCPSTCESEGFKYTCTGANESPLGGKCGDKYSLCNCAMGTNWKDGICQRPRCQIGWIYYVDGTCVTPAAHTTSKVALGVVVYVNADGIGGQVMATKSIGSTVWSREYVDIPSLPNYTSTALASTDYNSCSNTDKIVAYGSSSTYPAAHVARSYTPTAETKGKWCLPAAGIMTSIYNNKSAVRAGISKLGGTAFPNYTWSSSEWSNDNAWISSFDDSYGLYNRTKCGDYGYIFDVRPVLEF